MVLFGVDIVAFEVGFAFLVASGAVAGAYAIHVRLMSEHVRRVRRERRLALDPARSSAEAEPATPALGFARPSALILGLSSAQSFRMRDPASRHSVALGGRDFAHGTDG
jgi:hypothetical protein